MGPKAAFSLKIGKRLLDAGIVFYLLLIPIILFTGGFKITVLGVSLKGTHVFTPFRILLPLIFLRLLITLKIRDLSLVVLSAVICLAGLEVFIRVWNPPIASPSMSQIHRASTVLDWELVPGSHGVGSLGETYRINSLGFRDREFPAKKPAGLFRIMVIGDSFTFGMGVDLEDTYPKQIERVLRSHPVPCEVINCGVIGYNLWQHHAMLEQRVLPLEPDLVILGLFQDDLGAAAPPHETAQDRPGSNPFEPRSSSRVMEKSALWNFVKNATALLEYRYRYRRGQSYLKSIQERKKVWGPANPGDLNYRIMSGTAEEKIYRDFSRSLGEFASACRTGGAKVLVVMIPDSVQLDDPHMQAVNRYVEAHCRDIEVPYLDVTPVLEKEKNPDTLFLFPVDAHNSPRGLQLIGEAVSKRIVDLGLFVIEGSSGFRNGS